MACALTMLGPSPRLTVRRSWTCDFCEVLGISGFKGCEGLLHMGKGVEPGNSSYSIPTSVLKRKIAREVEVPDLFTVHQ